jgi:ABC-type amino acid transport system permease subunit
MVRGKQVITPQTFESMLSFEIFRHTKVIIWVSSLFSKRIGTIFLFSTRVKRRKLKIRWILMINYFSNIKALPAGIVILILIFFVSLFVYFLPSIIAIARHKKQYIAIFLLNLFTGWTFIGWVGSLIWSVMKEKIDKSRRSYFQRASDIVVRFPKS